MRGHFNNAKWSGAAAGLRAFSSLINALLAVRMLGVEQYGHLAVILSVFAFYLSLNAGFYTTLVARLMSPVVVGNPRAQSELLASTVALAAGSLIFLALLAGLLSWAAPSFLGLDKYQGMAIAYWMMPALVSLQMLALLQSAVIESAGRLDVAMKAQLVGPSVLLIMLSIVYLLHLSFSMQHYMATLCASAGIDICMLWIFRRMILRLPILYTGATPSYSALKKLLLSGSVLQAASLMNLFLEPMNKLLLSQFIGPAAVTTYDLAMKLIWGIQRLFAATMRVFLHFGHENGASINRVYTRVISLIAIPALIMHAFGAILLSWIAHRWVDLDASQLMIFYSIATISNLGMIVVMPFYMGLISRNDLGFIFRCQSVLALSNIIISASAIPFLGLTGAAIGLLAATIYNVVAIYLRHCDHVGRIDGIVTTLKDIAVRFLFTGIFFCMALYFGAQAELAELWLAILCIALFAIGMAEPLPRRIVTIGLKR